MTVLTAAMMPLYLSAVLRGHGLVDACQLAGLPLLSGAVYLARKRFTRLHDV